MTEPVNPSGLCECGCGQPASIARVTRSHLSHVKGQAVRFIQGHHLRIHLHGGHGTRWKGGRLRFPNGYIHMLVPGHANGNTRGYVYEHALVASRALGRPIPKGAEIHHINGDRSDNRNENLVICNDSGYHKRLHARERAVRACGNADWRRCKFCGTWDAAENLYIPSGMNGAYHRTCNAAYSRRQRVKTRQTK